MSPQIHVQIVCITQCVKPARAQAASLEIESNKTLHVHISKLHAFVSLKLENIILFLDCGYNFMRDLWEKQFLQHHFDQSEALPVSVSPHFIFLYPPQ